MVAGSGSSTPRGRITIPCDDVGAVPWRWRPPGAAGATAVTRRASGSPRRHPRSFRAAPDGASSGAALGSPLGRRPSGAGPGLPGTSNLRSFLPALNVDVVTGTSLRSNGSVPALDRCAVVRSSSRASTVLGLPAVPPRSTCRRWWRGRFLLRGDTDSKSFAQELPGIRDVLGVSRAPSDEPARRGRRGPVTGARPTPPGPLGAVARGLWTELWTNRGSSGRTCGRR